MSAHTLFNTWIPIDQTLPRPDEYPILCESRGFDCWPGVAWIAEPASANLAEFTHWRRAGEGDHPSWYHALNTRQS